MKQSKKQEYDDIIPDPRGASTFQYCKGKYILIGNKFKSLK